jgi:hypothetical protein
MSVSWTIDQLMGYVSTWSAVRALEKAKGRLEIDQLERDVREAWGQVPLRRISWPLGLRVGRISE